MEVGGGCLCEMNRARVCIDRAAVQIGYHATQSNTHHDPQHHSIGETGLFTNPETRDIARNVPAIIKALGDLQGLVVADVGAGQGLFSAALDEAVGPDGKVRMHTCRDSHHPALHTNLSLWTFAH